MCYAVIEVRYRHETEPDNLIPFKDADTLHARLEQLKKLETVERITVFRPDQTHQRVSSWNTTDHKEPTP